MNPQFRAVLVGSLGAIVGVVCAAGIAEENYGLVALSLLATFWCIAEWCGGAWPEVWLLAGALFGYIAGNRGFAQLLISERPPLLPAEAVLLVATPALFVRMAFKRAIAGHRSALNYAIALWMLLAAARLPLDLQRHGFLAVRDFAMVYYAAFFFLGQALAHHPASNTLINRALTAGFTALPITVIASDLAPDFFLTRLTFRGVPLIYYKSDLAAALLAAGFFWLWTRWETARRHLWLLPAGASLCLIGTMASPRAAMVAVAIMTFVWVVAGRPWVAMAQAGLGVAAVMTVLLAAGLTDRDLRATPVYSLYEHAASIFDFAGQGAYLHTESGDPGDNNRFRLVWWRAVASETLQQNPAFGLGFGYDLAARFLVDYDLLGAEDFSARSPHSAIMSVFGRMGLAGLAVWAAIAVAIARIVWQALKSNDATARGLASVVGVIWVSACFGVVLEGPMGAVVFWTVLGLLSARSFVTQPASDAASVAPYLPGPNAAVEVAAP